MRRTIAAILLLSMLLSVASCGSTQETETAAETSAAEVTETVPETEPEIRPELPDVKYDGYDFRILTAENREKFIYTEESTGELVNDAVYDSLAETMELLDVKVSTVLIASESDEAAVQTMIVSGDDVYDIGMVHDNKTVNLSLKGYFLNIHDLPYIDTTKPWWPQFTVDTLTLNNKMFYGSNYITYFSMVETKVCFFNEDILNDRGIEYPYDLVREGKWTLDTLDSLTAELYTDVNGNGETDVDDLYGITIGGYPYCWIEGFGVEMYYKEPGSNVITFHAEVEKTTSLVDKLYSIFCTGKNGAYNQMGNGDFDEREQFAKGLAAFSFSYLGSQIELLMDSEVRYGIVPMPKLDEAQEAYIGPCTDRPIHLPVTVADQEKTAVIFESLSYTGYKYILPAYRDKTLMGRYSMSSDSSEMLDLIFQNRVLSFTYLHTYVALNMLTELISKGTTDIASYVKKNQTVENNRINKILEIYAPAGE
ncbi:MAG: hypothetical protein IKV57_03130 [Clostridia bacterium]|nr:hypothetical protein [Clostridia bacterium]